MVLNGEEDEALRILSEQKLGLLFVFDRRGNIYNTLVTRTLGKVELGDTSNLDGNIAVLLVCHSEVDLLCGRLGHLKPLNRGCGLVGKSISIRTRWTVT